MKIKLTIITATIFILGLGVFVSAETTGTSSIKSLLRKEGENRMNLRQDNQDLRNQMMRDKLSRGENASGTRKFAFMSSTTRPMPKELREGLRTEMKQKISELKSNLQTNRKQRLANIIQIIESQIRALDEVVIRLEQRLDTIGTTIDSAKITEVEALLEEVKTTIAKNKDLLNDLIGNGTDIASSTPVATLNLIKKDAQDILKSNKTARTTLIKVLNLIKGPKTATTTNPARP